jgi:RNA polymerase sigma-70 factor (ECF subfamily)
MVAALASIVRAERTRLIATLVRRYGFDLAEESVDAAIEAALERWTSAGVPASPRAWLLSVAKRRAVDRVRHRAVVDDVHASLEITGPPEEGEAIDADTAEFPDDRLRLVFVCCHPAIAREAQVALALRWLSGLSTEDIARAFCVAVPTMAQRLTRAKVKIAAARIPYEVPERRELPERVVSVLEVIYAIFNEGYVATTGDALQRADLAEEALYLAELVVTLLPEDADAKAMFALLLLVHARRGARISSEGELVPLEEQDRTRWDVAMIARGKAMLVAALDAGRPSAYAVEAAIQALHDEATAYEATDFPQIVTLYGLLRQKSDAPIILVNEAVARAMTEGPEAALAHLLALDAAGILPDHPALPAAKAEMYRRLGKNREARAAYDLAIASTKNEVEQRFLARRKSQLAP